MKKVIPYIVVLLIILSGCNTDRNEVDGLLNSYENQEIDSRLEAWLCDLRLNGFEICKRSICIGKSKQEAIFNYEKQWQKDSLNEKVYETQFLDFYTDDSNKWNPSEIIIEGQSHPGRLIEFVIMNNNFISIGYTHGGFVTTPFFTTYEFENVKVKNHWTIYREDKLNSSKSEIAILSKQLLNSELEILK